MSIEDVPVARTSTSAASPPVARHLSLPRLDVMSLFVLPGIVLVLFVSVPMIALIMRAAESGNLLDSLQKPIVRDALRLSLITSTFTLMIAVLGGTPLA